MPAGSGRRGSSAGGGAGGEAVLLPEETRGVRRGSQPGDRRPSVAARREHDPVLDRLRCGQGRRVGHREGGSARRQLHGDRRFRREEAVPRRPAAAEVSRRAAQKRDARQLRTARQRHLPALVHDGRRKRRAQPRRLDGEGEATGSDGGGEHRGAEGELRAGHGGGDGTGAADALQEGEDVRGPQSEDQGPEGEHRPSPSR